VKALAAAAILFAGSAAADVVSNGPDSVNVAIYHQGAVDTQALMDDDDQWGAFGFVVEARTINLPAGQSIIRFRDVASTIVPESVQLEGLPQGGLERNFDYDLLSPGALLLRSVGRQVHLIRSNPATGEETDQTAIVRAAVGGPILDIGGRFEALHCGGPPERLVFDEVPDDLTSEPTLSVRVFSPIAGHYTIRLSYIATRMNWSADYVARVLPDNETLSLTGWITLANFSDTSFKNTPAQVIGGNPNTTGDDQAVEATAHTTTPQCWPLDIDWFRRQIAVQAASQQELTETVVVTGSRIPQSGLYSSSPVTAIVDDFGDYKLYTLPTRTDVSARQTKQVAFLDERQVKFRRLYSYIMPLEWENTDVPRPEPATVRYYFENREDAGLGKPLPGGTVSVIDRDDHGASVFAGQALIGDTPVDLPVRIDTGNALDVFVIPRLVAMETTGPARKQLRHNDIEVTITNGKNIAVPFELMQTLERTGIRISNESSPHSLDEGAAKWTLNIAPHQRVVLRYSIEYPLGDWSR